MILFIGNYLSKHGLNPTAIEDLAEAISKKYNVKKSSDKKNRLYRLMDMILIIIKSRNNCKLIIVDVFSTQAFLFAVIVIFFAIFFKIPFIPVLRGGYLSKRFKSYPRLTNYLFSRSRIIICPSSFFKKKFEGNRFLIRIIPNYIDLENYNFKKRINLSPNLLWVRSIHSIYNPIMAIRALMIIRKVYPDAKLCLVGPIKEDAIFSNIKTIINKFRLENNVKITGQLSKKKWAKLSEDYDVFINTSNIDNTPVTLLESMALGLPIVSTNVGGIPDLVENNETGILVNKDKEEEMARGILHLIRNPNISQLIASNAYNYVNQIDKKNIIPQWLTLINEMGINPQV